MNNTINAEDKEHAAWVGSHIDPVTDFEYDAIDRRLKGIDEHEPEDPFTIAGDGLRAIFSWCHESQTIEGALHRFVAASLAIDASLLDGKTQKEAAEFFGLKKASICKYAVMFCDRFQWVSRTCRKKDGRAAMRAARLRQLDAAGKVTNRHRSPKDAPQQADVTPSEIATLDMPGVPT